MLEIFWIEISNFKKEEKVLCWIRICKEKILFGYSVLLLL